jgi:hypothetical protein|tara:strand:+ start:1584 stop:1736 length:153 start_codon:yes stop_codon:yes gene_type:complete
MLTVIISPENIASGWSFWNDKKKFSFVAFEQSNISKPSRLHERLALERQE